MAFALVVAGPAAAQTSVKFSLDGRLEGPEALVLLPQDKGHFKTEGLDVTVDDAASPLEPITRVASGSYDGTVKLWEVSSGTLLRPLRRDRPYERMDITGLTGITAAQRVALLALGAVEEESSSPAQVAQL